MQDNTAEELQKGCWGLSAGAEQEAEASVKQVNEKLNDICGATPRTSFHPWRYLRISQCNTEAAVICEPKAGEQICVWGFEFRVWGFGCRNGVS